MTAPFVPGLCDLATLLGVDEPPEVHVACSLVGVECSVHWMFHCDTCTRLVPWDFGACDDMPGACDDCWAAAHSGAAP